MPIPARSMGGTAQLGTGWNSAAQEFRTCKEASALSSTSAQVASRRHRKCLLPGRGQNPERATQDLWAFTGLRLADGP